MSVNEGKKNLLNPKYVLYVRVRKAPTSNKSQAAHKDTMRDKRLQGQRKEFIDDTKRKSICSREELCIIVIILALD